MLDKSRIATYSSGRRWEKTTLFFLLYLYRTDNSINVILLYKKNIIFTFFIILVLFIFYFFCTCIKLKFPIPIKLIFSPSSCTWYNMSVCTICTVLYSETLLANNVSRTLIYCSLLFGTLLHFTVLEVLP